MDVQKCAHWYLVHVLENLGYDCLYFCTQTGTCILFLNYHYDV